MNVEIDTMRDIEHALWVLHEHNKLHFGEEHSTTQLAGEMFEAVKDILDEETG